MKVDAGLFEKYKIMEYEFFIQGKTAQQHGGVIHIGKTTDKKPFCGHRSFFEQVSETEIDLVPPDEFEKKHLCPAKIRVFFLGQSEVHFRDDFCQKCYSSLIKLRPDLFADFRFK